MSGGHRRHCSVQCMSSAVRVVDIRELAVAQLLFDEDLESVYEPE